MFFFNFVKTFLTNENFRENLSLLLIISKFYLLEEQWKNWWLRCQFCYDSMYVKKEGKLKAIIRIELTSVSQTVILHIETEKGTKEVYICPSGSPKRYHLRQLLSSEIYMPSNIG